MKKLLIVATLSITVAAVIKRVAGKEGAGYWSDGPHITLEAKKVKDYISSVPSEMYF